MKLNSSVLCILIGSLMALPAHADDAALKIDGDLMIHPNQLTEFFNAGATQVKSSTSWSWPSLQFTTPYKTSWTGTQAQGPFDIQIDTSSLKTQELGFSLLWNDPTLSVADFEIHDTVTQQVGGVNVVVHLDGSCKGVQVKVPGGKWVISGKMHWDILNNAFAVSWESFALQMNPQAAASVDMGQCQGQPSLIQILHDTAVKQVGDQAWLQSVMQQGVLDWMQTTLGAWQGQLLTERDFQIKDNIKVSWIPSTVATLPGGLLRVLGQFVLSKPGATVGTDYLPRNYDPAILGGVLESGFVLPKDSLQRTLNYMFSNGELQYRIDSTTVDSFQSLMNNSFAQFFVWPDLMYFDSSTKFYFDVTTAKVPHLSGGYMVDGGGSAYKVTMPLLAHQWAPDSTGHYLPYVDFTAPINGLLTAQISKGILGMQLQNGSLNLQSSFRREFAQTRYENTWISNSTLGSSVNDYLNSTAFSMPVPSWKVSSQFTLSLRDLQAWTQSFRMPLQLTPANP